MLRRPEGSALATAWLQAAFEPGAPGALRILNASENERTGPEVARLRLPPLDGGRVLRWRIPLDLYEGVTRLLFVVDSRVPEKAERVRPAWKLFETVEIPKESQMEPVIAEFGPWSGQAPSSRQLLPPFQAPPEPPRKVWPAMDLGPGFLAMVIPGEFEPLGRDQMDEVWRPGQPLPEAAALPAVPGPTGNVDELHRCAACGYETDDATQLKALSCPICGEPWL